MKFPRDYTFKCAKVPNIGSLTVHPPTFEGREDALYKYTPTFQGKSIL